MNDGMGQGQRLNEYERVQCGRTRVQRFKNDGSVSYHGGSLYKPRLHGPSANTTDLVKTKEKRFWWGS